MEIDKEKFMIIEISKNKYINKYHHISYITIGSDNIISLFISSLFPPLIALRGRLANSTDYLDKNRSLVKYKIRCD